MKKIEQTKKGPFPMHSILYGSIVVLGMIYLLVAYLFVFRPALNKSLQTDVSGTPSQLCAKGHCWKLEIADTNEKRQT